MAHTIKESDFFNRDLSWLSFNERVLQEASSNKVPLLERIKFLSIYSSNLDEFYRVRMPVLLALAKLSKKEKSKVSIPSDLLSTANQFIRENQQEYGNILREKIIPELQKQRINFIYGTEIPHALHQEVSGYFLSNVLAFMQPVDLETAKSSFFPNNNELYFLINLVQDEAEQTVILNIPSQELPRFYKIVKGRDTFIVFLDDIIRHNLSILFKNATITGCFSFKITRNAEIDLKDEYSGNLAEQIEKQLQKRDFGLATRFLYQPGIPGATMELLVEKLNLQNANLVEGGRYHNLKDLFSFPVNIPQLSNVPWPKISHPIWVEGKSLCEQIVEKDILINPPYQSYDSVLRFFNEAAIDPHVKEIYITLYRVANDSKIVNALISAAKNGKKVHVLVELKARFDEANNIKWAKKMKSAGVEIIYSVTALKVHAKIALVKRKVDNRLIYTGLFATGNFNETTASFYTDHILMTAHQGMLREMELVFIFLAKRIKPTDPDLIKFKYLLVAQFNLQPCFTSLIQHETKAAKNGKPASIIIKLNNLEEKVLIDQLYKASQAGVKIELIIRGICRLIPGIAGKSENITVTRIVDRYLEHGRIFVFHHDGDEQIYLGSADWMNRNIYRRIEVCFPILDRTIKTEIKSILKLQLADNVKAVVMNNEMKNVPVENRKAPVQSQQSIYNFFKNKSMRKITTLKKNKQITMGILAALLSTFFGFSCAENDKKNNALKTPPGYDITAPEKYTMPDMLQEVSGIAFNKGDNKIVYAHQDEDGSLFKLPLGTKDDTETKFAEKGDYEDVTIMNDVAILLASNGDLYSFPLSETKNEETTNVKINKDLLPKGEYEGMYGDEASGKLYVLCKNCKQDKDTKNASGYILSFQPDGTFKMEDTFVVDATNIDQLTGKKKQRFQPSALAINPLTKEWYIVSSVNKVLVVADSKWKIKAAYHLSSNTYNQPEGIAFDKAGNLYISNEGSETTGGNILRFDYKKP